ETLNHAAAMGGGGRSPPGHARVSSRLVELTRRVAERPQRCDLETERNPILEQDAGQHRSFQADSVRAGGARQRAGKDPTRNPRLGGRQASAVSRGSQRLQARESDLSLEEL